MGSRHASGSPSLPPSPLTVDDGPVEGVPLPWVAILAMSIGSAVAAVALHLGSRVVWPSLMRPPSWHVPAAAAYGALVGGLLVAADGVAPRLPRPVRWAAALMLVSLLPDPDRFDATNRLGLSWLLPIWDPWEQIVRAAWASGWGAVVGMMVTGRASALWRAPLAALSVAALWMLIDERTLVLPELVTLGGRRLVPLPTVYIGVLVGSLLLGIVPAWGALRGRRSPPRQRAIR